MNPTDLQHPELILAAFKYRAAYGVAQVVAQLDRHGKTWNAVLVELQRVSRAHCQYLLVHNFFAALQSDPLLSSSEFHDIHTVLRTLACLFGLHMMEKDLAEFIVCGYLSITQCDWVKEQVMVLLDAIRPQAVPLVDAFDLPDYYLHSALGRYDGKVYKAMTEMAEMEPLNHSVVVESYASSIRPLISQGWKGGLPGDSKL
jgi:acyl-CoA oxidase